MTYCYETEKPWLLTDEGQRVFIRSRDKILAAIKTTGAINGAKAVAIIEDAGDSWKMVAIIDRMAELGDIHKVTPESWSFQCSIYRDMR